MKFKIGDVVILKSASPAMTIHEIGDFSPFGPNPGLKCVWFDNTKKMEGVFHPDTVELYNLE
jgi:uncharacterized protein YodC (DUF2158 family)